MTEVWYHLSQEIVEVKQQLEKQFERLFLFWEGNKNDRSNVDVRTGL